MDCSRGGPERSGPPRHSSCRPIIRFRLESPFVPNTDKSVWNLKKTDRTALYKIVRRLCCTKDKGTHASITARRSPKKLQTQRDHA